MSLANFNRISPTNIFQQKDFTFTEAQGWDVLDISIPTRCFTNDELLKRERISARIEKLVLSRICILQMNMVAPIGETLIAYTMFKFWRTVYTLEKKEHCYIHKYNTLFPIGLNKMNPFGLPILS